MTVVTAPAAPPSRRRRVTAWMAIAVTLIVVGSIGAWIAGSGQWAPRDALDPESAGPAGTRALAHILRDHGIEVVIARDAATARASLADGDATLVLPDAPALSDEGLDDLAAGATDIVLVEPRARTLRLLLSQSSPAGYGGTEAVAPGCDLPEATRSGPIVAGSLAAPGDGVTGCYPDGDGFGLLVADRGSGRVAALDARATLTNEHLARDGNAALGVNLMGRHPVVVWYVPSLFDTDLENTDPSLGELTPPWVSPAIVLLLISGLAAAIWRGRRFGPLVAERLPVTVRASETAEGRGRLYARSGDAVHALDQLRIGSLTRLGRLLGLGRAASAQEIADAAAARLGVERGTVRATLIDDVPASDADLVRIAEHLHTLEQAVQRAVRPERNTT